MTRTLTLPTRDYGLMRQFKSAGETIAGFRIDFPAFDNILVAARRMVREQPFDICEMPLATYLCARDAGKPLTALPVFLTRGFHHAAIHVDARAGIDSPRALEGRSVAVNRGYTVTTGVWARRVLRDELGVDLDLVRWRATDDEHVSEFRPPPNVDYRLRGRSVADLFASGEIAAAVGAIGPPLPSVTPLIPDAAAAGAASFRRTGIYPINHVVVVRDALLHACPEVAPALFRAFAGSKTAYLAGLDRSAARSVEDGQTAALERAVGGDPFPYGIAPNRRALEAMIETARDQWILRDRTTVESLFAEATHDLAG